MDKSETHQTDPPSPAFIQPDSRSHLSIKLREKLEELGQWRIDPSLIEFPGDRPEFRGGNATVSRALLTFRSNGQGTSGSPGDTAVERPDPDGQNPKSRNDTQESGDSGEGVGVHQDDHPDGDGSFRAKTGERKGSKTGDSVPNPPSQPSMPKDVAVKKLKIDEDVDIERVLGLALRESEFLLELSHPNVIEIEGYVEDTSNHMIWLVFPWEENGNLRDFLASGEWEIPERISLINDVTKGVEYLHSQKPPIYHGDLKSLNVLVSSDYHAVITDFGSARRLADEQSARWTKESQNKPQPEPELGRTTDEGNTSLQLEAVFCVTTNTITLTGSKYTLRWAAPELLSEDGPTLASDIWALGWIAYEVMTENIPFHDVKKDTIVIKRVIQGDLPSITEHARMSLTRGLCSIMSQCWKGNPNQRPTAEECRKLLNWMPMMVPAPARTVDPEASKNRHAELLIQMGDMYLKQDDYGNAATCYSQSLDYYRDTSNSEGRANALFGLAMLHRFQGEHSKAIELFSEALHIYDDLGAPKAGGRARTLWALADVHRADSDDEKAAEFYSESLRIYTELGSRQGRAYVLLGLAAIHLSQSQYNEASALYCEALEITIEIGDKLCRAKCLRSIAEVHCVQREYDNAIKVLSESLQISTDLGDRQGRAETLWYLADTRYQQGHYNDAISLYTDTSKAYSEIGDSVWAAHALEKAADSRKKLEESS